MVQISDWKYILLFFYHKVTKFNKNKKINKKNWTIHYRQRTVESFCLELANKGPFDTQNAKLHTNINIQMSRVQEIRDGKITLYIVLHFKKHSKKKKK